MPGLILAAPSSGCGKTTVTLGLLRALSRMGHAVRGAKSGPDYIDPAYHAAATGKPCLNLDAWAMSAGAVRARATSSDLLIIEGAMGLFDGAPPDGAGSTADLARLLKLPVVLIIDAARMAQSIAPLVSGFSRHDPDVRIAGVILNNVGSDRHARMLRRALAPDKLPVLGVLPHRADLSRPSRHLGLVQALEDPALPAFLDRAADWILAGCDIEALVDIATALPTSSAPTIAPPGQRIAIAQDDAFSFIYPHHIKDWRTAGAEITFFSPLADEPAPQADIIFLPGGYPELHAGRLAAAESFKRSLKIAAEDTDIYGECGGYMAMGDSLTDADGNRHQMAGLLRLSTSFAQRCLHLGYRNLTATDGPMVGNWRGHEFHYATTLNAVGPPLFSAQDAEGVSLPAMGLRSGRAAGSFAHLIDRA